MSSPAVENLCRIPLDALGQGRTDVIDQVLARGFIDHDPPPGFTGGADALKSFVVSFRSAFPDLSYTIVREVQEGDIVVQQVTGSGTMRGEFMGMAPTGKRATWEEMHICRLQGDRCAEHWGVVDMLGAFQQLGLVPVQAQAA